MDDWKPKLAPATNLLALTLTNVEGFTVSRIDGNTTIAELAVLTQQTPEAVAALVERLVAEGALLPREGDAAPPEPVTEAEVEPVTEPEAAEPPAEEEADDDAAGTHLKLYSTKFKELSVDDRIHHAGVADQAGLTALAYDPLPQVIQALLENPRCGFAQARLIAAHHQNTAGLEYLFKRGDLLRDAHVQRLLLRNSQLNEGQLRRLLATKRLLELFKLSVSREASQQARAGIVRFLKSKFPNSSAEERVELLFTTEGRVLPNLTGVTLDGHTVALLTQRTFNSVMLIQSLARWGATPPAVLAHLLKQPVVMRNPRLKTLVSQHPNCPTPPGKG